ncbi:Mechanosensitive ion channel protein [Seminavis robusta]|uniref:Mechanosensitive ion channel protein n=1 Tax=Seminavis robusta TaxID=568900 RepID=A0A9N8HPT2_9STRA|nr:Mechanosensitive ion channel protein [Seminavis robusta]|eukprot:Sro1206_g252380.1 Mechanosensitive ion channel protein (1124) ;mRNA; r:20234-24313
MSQAFDSGNDSGAFENRPSMMHQLFMQDSQEGQEQDDLKVLEEKAPVEREAGRQIRKAWEELAKKANAKKKRGSIVGVEGDDDDDEDEGFFDLEEDDYAVALTRMTREKDDAWKENDSDNDEDDDDGGKQPEETRDPEHNHNGTVPGSPPASPPQSPVTEASYTPLRGDSIPLSTTTAGSRRALPKSKPKKPPQHKRKTHKRAESVEQAMFGLLSTQAALPSANNKPQNGSTTTNKPQPDRTKLLSKKARPVLESPLLATDQLIDTAQARVEEVQAQNNKAKKNQPESQPKNNEDEAEDAQKQRLQAIINENGDKDVRTNENEAMERIDEDDSEDDDENEESEQANNTANNQNDEENPRQKLRRKKSRQSKFLRSVTNSVQQDWELFQQFLTPREGTIWLYVRVVVFLLVLPSLIIAALLFYLKEYPHQQEVGYSALTPEDHPFVSWWFLFIGCRQVVTLSLALATQALVIDYLALGSRFSLKFFGPAVTLLAVQARGFPSILIFWSFYNLVLLSGDRRFAHHWLYWQDSILLFSEYNYSGHVVQSEWNFRILIMAALVGILVTIKRVSLGLFLARKTLSQFGDDFDVVKQNMLVVGELATLGGEIQYEQTSLLPFAAREPGMSVTSANLQTIKKTINFEYTERSHSHENDSHRTPNAAAAASAFVRKYGDKESVGTPGSIVAVQGGTSAAGTHVSEELTEAEGDHDFEATQDSELYELLGEWEGAEDRLERKKRERITVGSILRFYKELTIMNRRYPFLPVFGRADTREKTIKSAQRLFDRLMLRTPTMKKLPFSTIAILAKDDDGIIDKSKLRELIRLFRPDRDGLLGKLDFVRSIDEIYKGMRRLSLNVEDSGQIDKGVTFLCNVIFYFVIGAIVLQQLGVDPLQLFASFSSLILGFAFIFGSSSAKYFEGMLFILNQRPYGVGDRIHLSHPSADTNPNGSSGWIVEKVTLTTTTVYWGATNERATLSNGAISNLRVINAARSPKATIYVHTKFGIDTNYNKIQVFRSAAEQFLKQRPREWCAFLGFRPSEVVIDRGYISYTLIAQHRDGWQKIGGILSSKAKLTTYLLEVSKQLGMRYLSPPLPVDLSIKDASAALKAAGIKEEAFERGVGQTRDPFGN